MATAAHDSENATHAPQVRAPRGERGFFWWGAGAYLVVFAVMVVQALRITGGSIVFPLDDAAIHMTIARNLADHGTWGIEPGHFQSASSSPLWTLLMATFAFAGPGLLVAVPWTINVVASIWTVAVLGSDQRALMPNRSRPLDGPVVAFLVVIVLLLPAISMLGMEHTLHMAVVLSALVLFRRMAADEDLGWPSWLAYVLLGLATLVRFETAFVAAGLVVAFASTPWWEASPVGPRRRLPDRTQFTRAILVGAASLGPLVVVSVVNRAMGQGWLPNSILAKAPATSGDENVQRFDLLDRFTTDPLLALLTVAVVVAAIAGWRRRSFVFPAIVVAVAVCLHVLLASIGWYDRYQAYLILLCVYVLLRVGTEVAPAGGRVFSWWRTGVLVVCVLVLLAAGTQKVTLTRDVDLAASDTYEQRYQAGRFLARYYDGRPVGTSELGYISLDHDGPITDFYGLGDFEVLEIRRAQGQHPGPEVWTRLAEERGFDVAVVYPMTLWTDVPDEWILVGEWHLNRAPVTAFEPILQFWATRPEEVAPLREQLLEFESELPGGSTLHLDEFAERRAEELSADVGVLAPPEFRNVLSIAHDHRRNP